MIKVKNIVLGIGIVVVFALVLWQGIEAFYPSPKYDDFCSGRIYPEAIPLKENVICTRSQQLIQEEQQCYLQKGSPVYNYDQNGCQISVKECDFCNNEFEKARDKHAKIVFIISLITGIITLFVGYGVLSIEPVGSALIGSGIWAIFWGSVMNWRNFSNIWRFLLLFLTLLLLIWIALRLNIGKNKKGFWRKVGLKK